MSLPNLEIRAWAELTGTRLERFELAALRALDGAYMKTSAEKHI